MGPNKAQPSKAIHAINPTVINAVGIFLPPVIKPAFGESQD